MIESVNLPMYGVVLVHGEKTVCAESNGSFTNTLATFDCPFPNDHSRGGQSAQRFDRIGQNIRHKFVKDSVQLVNETFFDFTVGKPKISGLIIAGSGLFKDRVHNELHPILKGITICVRVTDSSSPHQVFQDAICDIKKFNVSKEMEWVNKFNYFMELDPDRCAFTLPELYKALETRGVETILINKDTIESWDQWYLTIMTPNGKTKSVFRNSQFTVPDECKLISKIRAIDWIKTYYCKVKLIELSKGTFDQRWGEDNPVVGILYEWYAKSIC